MSGSTENYQSGGSMNWIRWKCLVCGYVYEGENQKMVCPRCGNQNPDMFDDVD